MRLKQVRVRNFRGIKDMTVDLDETTVLIGENNTGKTAFLEAVRLCLQRLSGRGRGPFAEYDYHLASNASTPTGAEPIKINLVFGESASAKWDDQIDVDLGDVIAIDGDIKRIELAVTSSWDAETAESRTDWAFLDANGDRVPQSRSVLRTLQHLAPTFYVSALRDASKHFISRGRYWRRFLSETGIPDDARIELENQLVSLNSQVIDANRTLKQLRDYLDENTTKVVDLVGEDRVAISALPTQLFSLLSRAQVLLASSSGARIPVELQGEGTQSLAVLLIFGAFLRNRMSTPGSTADPIIALEEPEAHLHPSAIRSLMGVVNELPGQKIVSTHSGDLLASVNALAIRRFARVKGSVQSFRLGPGLLTADEQRKFNTSVRRTRGDLLFARCWLLVEGETEVILFEGAAEALEIDIVRNGVCCVQFAQIGIAMFAKVADQLGIEWYCVADRDSGGAKVKTALDRYDATSVGNRFAMPYEDVETMLCEHGFEDVYGDGKPGSRHKPKLAAQVVEWMTKQGEGRRPVPKPMESILRTAVEFAGGER